MSRKFVTFHADIPDDTQWNDKGDMLTPGGKAVAEKLRAILQSQGCSCSQVAQHSFYGWAFDTSSENVVATLLVAADADGWLLQIDLHRSLFGRLFKGKRDAANVMIATVHDVLQRGGCFSDVRWYTRDDYEHQRYDKASPSP